MSIFGGYTWAVQEGMRENDDRMVAKRDKMQQQMKMFLDTAAENGQQLSPAEYLQELDKYSDGSNWLKGQGAPSRPLLQKMIAGNNEKAKAVVADRQFKSLQMDQQITDLVQKEAASMSLQDGDNTSVIMKLQEQYQNNPVVLERLKKVAPEMIGDWRLRATNEMTDLYKDDVAEMEPDQARSWAKSKGLPNTVVDSLVHHAQQNQIVRKREQEIRQQDALFQHKLQIDTINYQDKLSDENLAVANGIKAVDQIRLDMQADPRLAAALSVGGDIARNVVQPYLTGTNLTPDMAISKLQQAGNTAYLNQVDKAQGEIVDKVLSDKSLVDAINADQDPKKVGKLIESYAARYPQLQPNTPEYNRVVNTLIERAQQVRQQEGYVRYTELTAATREKADPYADSKVKEATEFASKLAGSFEKDSPQAAAAAAFANTFAIPDAMTNAQVADYFRDADGTTEEILAGAMQQFGNLPRIEDYRQAMVNQYVATNGPVPPMTMADFDAMVGDVAKNFGDIDGYVRDAQALAAKQGKTADRLTILQALRSQIDPYVQRATYATNNEYVVTTGRQEDKVNQGYINIMNTARALDTAIANEAAKAPPPTEKPSFADLAQKATEAAKTNPTSFWDRIAQEQEQAKAAKMAVAEKLREQFPDRRVFARISLQDKIKMVGALREELGITADMSDAQLLNLALPLYAKP